MGLPMRMKVKKREGETKEMEMRLLSLRHRVNKLLGVDDMTALYHLHEPGILSNLEERSQLDNQR